MNLPLRRRAEPPLPPVILPEPDAATIARRGIRRVQSQDEVAICYHCASTDTMEPFTRGARVFVLSRILPSLRWRYCRTCTRHFLTLRGDEA